MQPDPAHKSTMPAGWSRLLALITAATLGAQAVAAPVTFDFSGLDGTFGKQLTVTDAGSGIAATLTAVFNLVEVQFDAPGGMIVNRNNRLVQVPQTINAVTGKGLGIGTDHPALPGGNPLADGSTGFSLGGTLLTVTTEAFLLTFSGSDVNPSTRFELVSQRLGNTADGESAASSSVPEPILDPLALERDDLGGLVGFGFDFIPNGPDANEEISLDVRAVAPIFGLTDGLFGRGFLLSPGRVNGNTGGLYLPGVVNDWSLLSVTVDRVPGPTALTLLIGLAALLAVRSRRTWRSTGGRN